VQGYKTGTRNLLSYKICILISVMISISKQEYLYWPNTQPCIPSQWSLLLYCVSYLILLNQYFLLPGIEEKQNAFAGHFSDLIITILVFSILYSVVFLWMFCFCLSFCARSDQSNAVWSCIMELCCGADTCLFHAAIEGDQRKRRTSVNLRHQQPSVAYWSLAVADASP
jgi:hypothetical protein